MKIGYLGVGSWGFCLSLLLEKNGHDLVVWTSQKELADRLNRLEDHPLFPGISAKGNIRFTIDLQEAIQGKEMIIESLTSSGIRPVLSRLDKKEIPAVPIVLTSKGIEQASLKILSEVVLEVLGDKIRPQLGCISGPGYAQEVIRGLPTSLVASGYRPDVIQKICQAFNSDKFRVYPNSDMRGVAFGGALKNVIAIACGIAEGLGLGWSTKAALICRGLHEMRKLAISEGCFIETLNGLSGMGDLCLTCSSPISRNFRFGMQLAEGKTPEEALKSIGMVVEGKYTAKAALELSLKNGVAMPITEMVYRIIYEHLPIKKAIQSLMKRKIKEEHL